MVDKPISLKRKEYIQAICSITNNCGLPAFVVVDVLDRILIEMRNAADMEIKRDEAMWHKAQQEQPKTEVMQNDDGK